MRRVFSQGEVMGQLASFNGMLNELVVQADSILKTISSFTDDGNLQGVAYSSMKERMHTVHGGIWRAIRYCAEVMISENNRILPTKINYFNDVYVDTDIIRRTIDSLNMNNRFLKAFPNLTIGTEYLYQRNLNTIRTLELKLSNIDAYDSSTAGFFSEANQCMNHIMNALTQLQNDDYDAATGTFKNTIDMGWSNDISVKYKELMLQKFVNADGTITEAGKKYFGDAMKKDYLELTMEELDILTEIVLRAGEQDMTYLLNAGYCEHKDLTNIQVPNTSGQVGGHFYMASKTFKLVLANAYYRLESQVYEQIPKDLGDDEEGRLHQYWETYYQKIRLIGGMLATTYLMKAVKADPGKQKITIKKKANGDYTIFADSLINDDSQVIVDMGIELGAESSVREDVFVKLAQVEQDDWFVSLLGYVPILNEITHYSGMIGDVAQGLKYAQEALTGEKVLNPTEKGMLDMQKSVMQGSGAWVSTGADAVNLGNLADTFGLYVYKIGDVYQYSYSSATETKLEEFNADIKKLKGGLILPDEEFDSIKGMQEFKQYFTYNVKAGVVYFEMDELNKSMLSDYQRLNVYYEIRSKLPKALSIGGA